MISGGSEARGVANRYVSAGLGVSESGGMFFICCLGKGIGTVKRTA